MILIVFDPKLYPRCILHVCGDDPKQNSISFEVAVYSPRMWRWSYHSLTCESHRLVFSTYVEMILKLFSFIIKNFSILHVCGDDPQQCCWCNYWTWYSPRMWRWSCWLDQWRWLLQVFSTYVEMILYRGDTFIDLGSILHVCGDDPIYI